MNVLIPQTTHLKMVNMVNFMFVIFATKKIGRKKIQSGEFKHQGSLHQTGFPEILAPYFQVERQVGNHLPHSTSIKRSIALPSILLGMKQTRKGLLGGLNNTCPSFSSLKLNSHKKPLFSLSLETKQGGILGFPGPICPALLPRPMASSVSKFSQLCRKCGFFQNGGDRSRTLFKLTSTSL